MMLTVYCAMCGKKGTYKMSLKEAETLSEYRVRGREMGYLQNLFPDVPAWIRSGAIDLYAGGFCICPDCCEWG